MLERRPVFPGVIEMNSQAGWRIGCNVYLVYDDRDWALIDIGYEESVDEIIELIRQMDFPLSQCQALVATHADVDHIQGLAKAKSILKAPVLAHPKAVPSLESGDRIKTFAEIGAQNVHLDMPKVKVDRPIVDGDKIGLGAGVSAKLWGTRLDVGYGHIIYFDRTIGQESIVTSGNVVLPPPVGAQSEPRTRVAMGRYSASLDELNVAVTIAFDEMFGFGVYAPKAVAALAEPLPAPTPSSTESAPSPEAAPAPSTTPTTAPATDG